MAESGLVTIGAHTATHPLLATEAEDEVRWEVSSSRDRLRQALGTAPVYMAYPYGQPAEIGAHAEEAASEAGLRAAFTTVSRPLQRRDLSRPFALPRTLISRKGQSTGVVRAYMTRVPSALRSLRGR